MPKPTETTPSAVPETSEYIKEIKGLDALNTQALPPARTALAGKAWAATWPKLAALGLFVLVWQVVVWLEIKPEYVLPSPASSLNEFVRQLGRPAFWQACTVTLTRGLIGFAISATIGLVLGVAVARSRVLRSALGSLITGLQTMPSIAWFPLAIMLFQLSETAIIFVILIGATPSIANGVITGVDYVPSLLISAGRTMGARGLALYRHIIIPAALPSVVSGLKQGWAFAWRSLLAGELIVAIANRPSLGTFLSNSRELGEPPYMIALMIAILIIGVLVDAVFSAIDNGIRRRRGLLNA